MIGSSSTTMATCSIADLQKVAIIFEAADLDKDARLNSAELTTLIKQCNPKVCFSVVQLEAIVQEVCYSQTHHMRFTLRLCVLISRVLLAF